MEEHLEQLSGIITALKIYTNRNTTCLTINNSVAYIQRKLSDDIVGQPISALGHWRSSLKQDRYFVIDEYEIVTASSIDDLPTKLFGRKYDPSESELKTVRILSSALTYLLQSKKITVAKKLTKMSVKEALLIQEDPWRLYIKGLVDFETAEVIADKSVIIRGTQPGRIRAAIVVVLEKAYNSGHVSMAVTDLLTELSDLLSINISQEILMESLNSQTAVVRDGSVYKPKIFYLRQRTLAMAAENPPTINCHEDTNIDQLLSYKKAILTGPAGSGKTTLLLRLNNCLSENGYSVALTAMTGKAASVLSENARTLHSYLGYGRGGFKVTKTKEHYIIVDEATMMDWYSAFALFRAAKAAGSGIILCGDPDQLPPIKGGSVFAELLPIMPVVKLEKLHRFVNGAANVQFIPKNSVQEILSAATVLAITMARKGEDFQILTPVKGNLIGTCNLNKILQAKLNPFGKQLTAEYRLGDRVIVTKNCYNKETTVYNGQIGTIVDHEYNNIYVRLQKSHEVLPFLDSELALAYCLTVHKAQGSQYDKVVFVAPKSLYQEFIDHKMMHTGNTRGRVATYCLVY